MFPTARWKAYLLSLKNSEEDSPNDCYKVIYHIYHSQALWFVQDEANHYQKAAEDHLKHCDELLGECKTLIDGLEERLANTPKPSEVLDWNSL